MQRLVSCKAVSFNKAQRIITLIIVDLSEFSQVRRKEYSCEGTVRKKGKNSLFYCYCKIIISNLCLYTVYDLKYWDNTHLQ